MDKQNNKPLKPTRYLILDTNIFKHLGNSELAPQIIYLLQDAYSKGYVFAVSKFTLLELLDTATIENEIIALGYLKGLKHFKMKDHILIAAGHFGCLYKDDGIEEKQQPEKGDKILAGTAWANNALIFTTNGRHFPPPFFNYLAKPVLKHTKNKADVYTVFYFIEPDYSVIDIKHQARINEYQKKNLPEVISPTEK